MRVSLFNANGLSGKAEIIKLYMTEHKIDVMIIVETHLNTNNSKLMNPVLTCTKTTMGEGGRGSRGGISVFLSPQHPRTIIEPIMIDKESDFIIFGINDTVIAAGYFPPENEEFSKKLFAFLEKAKDTAEDKPLLVLGDFNARMGAFSGDHATNTRGTRLRDWILQSDLTLAMPTSGKYTSFGGASGFGRGITDVLLTKQADVFNYSVYEELTLGGSDHRPLIFETQQDMTATLKNFQRWDIRKLTKLEIRDKYKQFIDDRLAETMDILDQTPEIEAKWSIVKNLIAEAAKQSCGIFKINNSHNLRNDFSTEILNKHRDKVKEQEELVAHLRRTNWANTGVKSMAIHTLRTLRKETKYLKKLHEEGKLLFADRRRELFEEMVDNLADPQNKAAFMRMVKTNKGRNSRDVCQLDPELINTHAQHFQTTFGSQPGALHEEFNWRINNNPMPQTAIQSETVFNIAKHMALGKAAGQDGITGELIRYGGMGLAIILTNLFNSIASSETIPEDWKIALIVPVFKRKGNPKEIKNYRPIALTSVARRLYEKVLLLDLEEAQLLLHDCQGGFRHHRSTLDQAYVLHEILVHNKNTHSIFLDFRAAYDLVDRRILWAKLATQFNITTDTIKRLKALFDHNKSVLVIRNQRSEPIHNMRGLLQGSSLSPLLFNFSINDLTVGLNNLPTITTLGKRTNCLLFADDANIHARSAEDLQRLLKFCEEWSRKNAMEFAPSKCVYMGPENNHQLELYGETLPTEESFKYLGIWFNQTGIDAEKTVLERTKKAMDAAHILGSMGFNPTGWCLRAATNIYRTFIRPSMEYGLALMDPKDKKLVELLEKTQAGALRRMMGASNSDSRAAMAKLVTLEPMHHRIKVLNAGFALRLHDNNDATIPASIVWRNGLQGNNKDSVAFKTVKRNDYWPKFSKTNHLVTPLKKPVVFNRGGAEPPSVIRENPVTYRKKDAGTEIKRKLKADSLQFWKGNIADAVPLNHKRKLLNRGKLISRRDRVTLLRWRIGNVCKHQICCKCGDVLTRAHGCECSGANEYIRRQFSEIWNEIYTSELCTIDALLNKIDNSRLKQDHQKAAHAIGLVMRHCRNLDQTHNHFWRPMDGTDKHAARWNRAIAQHIVVPVQQPLRPTIQRNVRSGRRPRQAKDPTIG